MLKKDCKDICNLLNQMCKTKVILSIILFSMTLVACASRNSAEQTNSNNEKQEDTEIEQIVEESNVSGNEITEESNVSNNEITEESNVSDNEISDESNVKVEISMEEAIEIASKEAHKYYENLELTRIHTYDNDYEPSITAGEDGKREWWYVAFGNEASNYVIILIQNGVIIEEQNFDKNGNNGLFNVSEIQMTSEEAVKKAYELGLRGGDPEDESVWVSGYNFDLSYGSLVKSPKDIRIFMEVIGVSVDGNFASVNFDAKTGELLLAEQKIEYEDGTAEWRPLQE